MKKILIFIQILFTTHFVFSQPSLALQVIATGFNQPVAVRNAGDDRLFIVEQDGYIKILYSDGSISTFMDIDARVGSGGSEQGLLGLAFHPDYASNGYFFVNYTNNSGNTRLSRFSVDAINPNIGNDASELVLKTITQPYSNHNGGDLAFGPDGYLYVAMGDGGSGGDPGNRAQDTTSQLLGKMLRLDVDIASPYIPASNPYVGITGDDEIWSYGLRNPWRFSFDRLTGDMWIGDVGQGSWEEVDFQSASSTNAVNYGWRCYEGNHEYNTSLCGSVTNEVFPIFEYNHSFETGGYAITGGYVYRGSEFAGMYGYYITCDYVTGNFWIINPNGVGGWVAELIPGLLSDISSFGESFEGEIYGCNLSSGEIYHLIDENCGAVWGISETAITSTSATISWEDVGSPNYKFSYRIPGSAWITSTVISPTKSLIALSPSTNYNYRIRNKCSGVAGQFTKMGSFLTLPLKSNEMNENQNTTSFIQISPGIFQFHSSADELFSIKILNLSGQNIYHTVSKNGDEINISYLESGIYFIEIILGNKFIETQKVVII